jgi:hypothetical protein
VSDAAAVVGAAGALAAIAGRGRIAVLAGLAAIAAAEVMLASDLVPGSLTGKLTSAGGAAGLVLGLPLLAVLGAAFVRWPALVPPVVVAAAPFRLPFDVGAGHRLFIGLGENGALGRLVPLYAVLAGAGIALAWRAVRGETPRPLPLEVAIPAGLLAALMTVSLLWAYDDAAARDRLAFFILPFSALLAIVARAPFRAWLPKVLAIEAVAIACLFAAVGIGEAWTHRLLFYDPKLDVANTYTSYFRVTSLFDDPSIYARHLAAAITILVVALWLGRVTVVAGVGLIAFIWAGMFFSYSQSSMVALGAAVVVVSFLVAGRKTRRTLVILAASLLAVGAIAFAGLLATGHSITRVTSDRSTLIRHTWVVFRNHPLDGVGLASQPAATRDETDGPREVRLNVSHTAPLTVAAELGALGLFLYFVLLLVAFRLFQIVRRAEAALGLGLIGVFTVWIVHSLSYGVFFEDPLVWAALGVGACAAAAAVGARSPAGT